VRAHLPPALASGLVLLLASACGGSRAPTTDIVASIPWGAQETLSYLITDEKGTPQGRAVLSVAGEGAHTRLSQRFSSGESSDETSVLVDRQTLKPLTASRVIVSPGQREEIGAVYGEEGVVIRQGDRQSGLSLPDHSYDNDTSLFLWRAIPFEAGYTASYTTIITNRRSRQTVTLSVSGPEEVSVAAGRFRAWRVRVKTSNAEQTAWYADTPARPLVKYDNDRGTIFELESLP